MSDDEALVGEEDAFISLEIPAKEKDVSMNKNSNATEDSCSGVCVIAHAFTSFIAISLFTAAVVSDVMGKTNIYIEDVYIPALDTSTSTGSNGTASFNASIIVDLKYHRELAMFSDDHKESQLVVYYSHEITPAGGYRVEAFSTGRIKTVHKIVAMEAPGVPWEAAFRAVSAGSTVELVMEFGKLRRGTSEQSGSVWSGHVAVDASGHMVPKGPLGLSYISY